MDISSNLSLLISVTILKCVPIPEVIVAEDVVVAMEAEAVAAFEDVVEAAVVSVENVISTIPTIVPVLLVAPRSTVR